MSSPTTIPEGLLVPELWSKDILRNFDDYGVMAGCVNKNWEGEIKYQGDTVHITKFGDVVINEHSDTENHKYQNIIGDETILHVDQIYDWGIRIGKIDTSRANMSVSEFRKAWANRARVAMLNHKDKYIFTLGYAGVKATNQLGTKAATKDNIYDICLDLFQNLADSNAIGDDGRGEDNKRPFLVVPPAIIKLMKAAPEMTHATVKGDDTVRQGTIMEFAGFDIKQTTLTKNESGYKILAGTTEAITYADKVADITTIDKDVNHPFDFYLAGLYYYGAKVVQPAALTSANLTIEA